MSWLSRSIRLLCLSAGMAFTISSTRGAVVDLELALTPMGGFTHYEATVRNNGLVDLTLVSIVDAPPGDALIDPSLAAPVGFLALYDAGLGIIDFLEGTSTFGAGNTVSGFSFDSMNLPGLFFSSFEAFDIEGNFITGTIAIKGGAVPDSHSSFILAAAALLWVALVRRFRSPRRG